MSLKYLSFTNKFIFCDRMTLFNIIYAHQEHVQEFEPYLTSLNQMFGDDLLPKA